MTDDGGSPAACAANTAFFLPATSAIAWWRFREDEALLSRLFQYRFDAGRGLRGHSFGNLFLTALTNVTGDFARRGAPERPSPGDSRPHFPFDQSRTSTLEAVIENGRVDSR